MNDHNPFLSQGSRLQFMNHVFFTPLFCTTPLGKSSFIIQKTMHADARVHFGLMGDSSQIGSYVLLRNRKFLSYKNHFEN